MAGGSGDHPGFLSGRFYSTIQGTSGSTVAVPAVDVLYLYPFFLPRKAVITAINFRVTTGGAGSSVKAGIWASSANGPVGAPIVANNTGVATTSGSVGVTLAAAGSIGPGLLWAGSKFTGTLPSLVGVGSTNLNIVWLFGAPTLATSFGMNAISMADTYSGNLPIIAADQVFANVVSSGVPLMGFTT